MNGKFSILVADKSRAVREFLKQELVDAGYSVVVAEDGDQVVKQLSALHGPDLLLLDLEITGLDGPEVLKRARAHEPPLPVIIHTFLTEEAERDFPETDGVALAKNGNAVHLKSAITEMLDRFFPDRQ